MSLDYKFEPLDGFPRELTPSWKRDKSPFGKTWTDVQILLEKELRFLSYRAGSVFLQTAHSEWDVRKDGKLRSDVRAPEHPGVVLKFDVYDSKAKRYVQMSFECDRFVQWKANVRAIADAMEALRKVDRYGVSGGGKTNAHYEGYKALPPAGGENPSRQNAAEFIAKYSDYPPHALDDKELLTKAYRQAALLLHPDKGGTADDFHKLTKAYEVLK